MGKPTGIPDELMLTKPVWSSWAQYKANINDTIITEFANEIIGNGFTVSSTFPSIQLLYKNKN